MFVAISDLSQLVLEIIELLGARLLFLLRLFLSVLSELVSLLFRFQNFDVLVQRLYSI